MQFYKCVVCENCYKNYYYNSLLIEFLNYVTTTDKSYTKDTHSMTDVLLYA